MLASLRLKITMLKIKPVLRATGETSIVSACIKIYIYIYIYIYPYIHTLIYKNSTQIYIHIRQDKVNITWGRKQRSSVLVNYSIQLSGIALASKNCSGGKVAGTLQPAEREYFKEITRSQLRGSIHDLPTVLSRSLPLSPPL